MNENTIIMAGGGTGGHVFPMIAVADALRRVDPTLRLVFVGTERGQEVNIVPERGYELRLVDVQPMRGGGLRQLLRGSGRALMALPDSRKLLSELKPRAVFSIGGYAAGPICLAARMSGVPVALMEPNSVIGLANQLIAKLVRRAYTAFPDCEHHFHASKVLRTGVPIRAGFDPAPYVPAKNALEVLVLGGSQGARALNETVPQALLSCRTPVRVVHQVGRGNVDEVTQRYSELGAGTGASVVPFIDDMPAAIARAHLVVSRSGASAVSEICAVGRPSLLVPYPFAAGDHQLHNALSLEKDGASVCVPQEEASREVLATLIDGLAEDKRLSEMAERARDRGRPNAAHAIARDLMALSERKHTEAKHAQRDVARDDTVRAVGLDMQGQA